MASTKGTAVVWVLMEEGRKYIKAALCSLFPLGSELNSLRFQLLVPPPHLQRHLRHVERSGRGRVGDMVVGCYAIVEGERGFFGAGGGGNSWGGGGGGFRLRVFFSLFFFFSLSGRELGLRSLAFSTELKVSTRMGGGPWLIFFR